MNWWEVDYDSALAQESIHNAVVEGLQRSVMRLFWQERLKRNELVKFESQTEVERVRNDCQKVITRLTEDFKSNKERLQKEVGEAKESLFLIEQKLVERDAKVRAVEDYETKIRAEIEVERGRFSTTLQAVKSLRTKAARAEVLGHQVAQLEYEIQQLQRENRRLEEEQHRPPHRNSGAHRYHEANRHRDGGGDRRSDDFGTQNDGRERGRDYGRSNSHAA